MDVSFFRSRETLELALKKKLADALIFYSFHIFPLFRIPFPRRSRRSVLA